MRQQQDVSRQRADELCGPACGSNHGASGVGVWLFGVPLVCILCWLPSRRSSSGLLLWHGWRETSPVGLAGMMTSAQLASCILFMVGQGAIRSHQLALYWIISSLLPLSGLARKRHAHHSLEEWVGRRLSSRPESKGFFVSVLRTNLLHPGAGHGGSRCAHPPQAVKVTRFSRQTSQHHRCSKIRPVSLSSGFQQFCKAHRGIIINELKRVDGWLKNP